MEFQAEFTPLRPGMIRDIFSPKRQGGGYDPLGLPKDPRQCVHVEVSDDDKVGVVRCIKDATTMFGRHGWLCERHGYFTPFRGTYRPVDKDQEIVEGIIASEARAIRRSNRVEVRVGSKTRISFVA